MPYEPLLNFWVKLQKNPSHRAVNSLYDFLLAHNYPITPEGNFIAYRGVKADWTDQHTGTMDNSVGTVVSMPRNEVDENPDHTCSTGLHIGNWEHANGSYGLAQGGHTVMVEVSPENVVSIPSAYENAKMRVCEFKVLQEVEGKITGNLYNPNFVSHDEEEDDSDEECYYEHKINYDSDCEEEDCCHNIGCEDCWEGCAEK